MATIQEVNVIKKIINGVCPGLTLKLCSTSGFSGLSKIIVLYCWDEKQVRKSHSMRRNNTLCHITYGNKIIDVRTKLLPKIDEDGMVRLAQDKCVVNLSDPDSTKILGDFLKYLLKRG